MRKVEEKKVREETVFHTNRVVLMPLLLCRHIELCVTSSTDCFHETFFLKSIILLTAILNTCVCYISPINTTWPEELCTHSRHFTE